MASETKVDFPPLLAAGFHTFDVRGLQQLCVNRFPDSLTRRTIMDGLNDVLDLLNQNGMRGDVWVNGSFTTEKLNPDDSDILLVMSINDFNQLTVPQKQFFEWFQKTSLKPTHRCDNYAMIQDTNRAESDWFTAYWLRQFGFSRTNEMKGMAVVQVPFLVKP